MFSFSLPWLLGFFPLDSLFSTQGIMVMLLVAYGGAMWMFLSSAPKVHTVMVSDLEVARQFYEGLLSLPVAQIPLHYYHNYEQTLGGDGFGSLYSASTSLASPSPLQGDEGLWYQLKKNAQLHIVSGANLGHKNRQRHVCFDHACLEELLLRIQTRGIKHKIRRDRPLNFLVKDIEGRVLEIAEVSS